MEKTKLLTTMTYYTSFKGSKEMHEMLNIVKDNIKRMMKELIWEWMGLA